MQESDRIAEPWGRRTPVGSGPGWPARVETHLADGVAPEDMDRWAQTAGFEIEDVRRRTVLAPARTGDRAAAVRGAPREEVSAVAHEVGVRRQL